MVDTNLCICVLWLFPVLNEAIWKAVPCFLVIVKVVFSELLSFILIPGNSRCQNFNCWKAGGGGRVIHLLVKCKTKNFSENTFFFPMCKHAMRVAHHLVLNWSYPVPKVGEGFQEYWKRDLIHDEFWNGTFFLSEKLRSANPLVWIKVK